MNCPHVTFKARVDVVRYVGPPTEWAGTVRVHCADCGQPFRFFRDAKLGHDDLQLGVRLAPGPGIWPRPVKPPKAGMPW